MIGKDIICLKKKYQAINNIITTTLIKKFIKEVCSKRCDKKYFDFLLNKYSDVSKANNNGFDFYDSKLKIVAEAKSFIPVKDNLFGSQQRDGIIIDIQNLINGKAKQQGDIKKFIKFFVLLDNGNRQKIINAFEKVINSKNCPKIKYEIFTNKTEFKDNNKIYIIILNIDNEQIDFQNIICHEE